MRVVSTSLDEVGDLAAPPGSRAWAVAVRLEIRSALHDAEYSAERLRTWLSAMEEHAGYRQLEGADGAPFPSYEAFCVAGSPFGLGYDRAALDRIYQERKSVEARAAAPQVLRAPTHPGPGRGKKKTDSERNGLSGGENADYLTARIARDHPAVLAEMRAGQHRSVRAAARQAGLVKERWSVPAESPAAMAAYLRRRLTVAQCAELARRLVGDLAPLLLAALLTAATAGHAQAQEEAGAGGSVTVGAPVLVGCRVALFTAYSIEQFPGTTASGVRTPGNAGWIVAHGRNSAEGLPFGTLVWIDGLGLRSVQDRGGGLSAGHFDVLLATTAEARRFGVQRLEVCEVAR